MVAPLLVVVSDEARVLSVELGLVLHAAHLALQLLQQVVEAHLERVAVAQLHHVTPSRRVVRLDLPNLAIVLRRALQPAQKDLAPLRQHAGLLGLCAGSPAAHGHAAHHALHTGWHPAATHAAHHLRKARRQAAHAGRHAAAAAAAAGPAAHAAKGELHTRAAHLALPHLTE